MGFFDSRRKAMKKNRIAIADDHQLFRDGLKAMINSRADMEVVAEAGEGVAAIQMVRRLQPDLLLLDLSMPKLGGVSVLTDLKKELPHVKILVLTIHDSDSYVLEVFKAGANGYCVKHARWEELLTAMETVLEGKTYMSPSIASKVMEGYLEGRKRLKSTTTWDTVTQREREVLKLLGEGYRSKEIAELLSISVKTVNTHRNNLMNKLDLHSASALTAYAIEKGLVSSKT
jgi:DNA-binding NarL/FixJ family response regulator